MPSSSAASGVARSRRTAAGPGAWTLGVVDASAEGINTEAPSARRPQPTGSSVARLGLGHRAPADVLRPKAVWQRGTEGRRPGSLFLGPHETIKHSTDVDKYFSRPGLGESLLEKTCLWSTKCSDMVRWTNTRREEVLCGYCQMAPLGSAAQQRRT